MDPLLLKRRRLKGRFNKRVKRVDEVDRDIVRLAFGIRNRPEMYTLRKIIKKILHANKIEVDVAWSFQEREKMVKVVNDCFQKLKTLYRGINLGITRLAVMHTLQDSVRTIRWKLRGYKSIGPLRYPRGPPRAKKYATEDTLFHLSRNDTITNNKGSATRAAPPAQPAQRNKNPSNETSMAQRRVQGSPEQLGESSRSRGSFDNRHQRTESEQTTGPDEESVDDVNDRWTAVQDESMQAASTVENEQVEAVEVRNLSPRVTRSRASIKETPASRQITEKATKKPTTPVTKSIKDEKIKQSSSQLGLMGPPSTPLVKRRPSPTAALRVEYVASMDDSTVLSSFVLSLYKRRTLQSFILSIETNIKETIDYADGFFVYLPLDAQEDAAWQIIKDIQDIIRMFITEGRKMGVYLCFVDTVSSIPIILTSGFFLTIGRFKFTLATSFYKNNPERIKKPYAYHRAVKCESRSRHELFSGGTYTFAELEATQYIEVFDDKDPDSVYVELNEDGKVELLKYRPYRWQMQVR